MSGHVEDKEQCVAMMLGVNLLHLFCHEQQQHFSHGLCNRLSYFVVNGTMGWLHENVQLRGFISANYLIVCVIPFQIILSPCSRFSTGHKAKMTMGRKSTDCTFQEPVICEPNGTNDVKKHQDFKPLWVDILH